MKIFKTDIRLKTFFQKGTKKIDDAFGVYLITGKQGTNKSWFATYFASYQLKENYKYIKTNVKSLNVPGFEMKYFTKISEIIDDTDEEVLYIIDEISKKYKKTDPCDKPFYSWMNQSRKRKRVLILITQEYLELPMWLRRPCRFMFTNTKIPILTKFFGIFKCTIGDGYNLVYDKDEGIYTCPPIMSIIYKRTQKVADMYDTFEPITDL